MSPNKELQEEVAASLNSQPKSQKTTKTLVYLSPPNSPAQTNPNTSKARSLNDWRCGGITQKKEPCKRQIPAESKDQIISQISSMVAFISSSELGSELDKLAKLIHCYQHDHGYPKDSRIDDWIAAFAVRDGNTNMVVPIEKEIKKALGRVSTQCIGITAEDKRCKQGIGGQKVQNCTKTINEIVKPEVYYDDTYLDALLKGLETNMYCRFHTNKDPLKNVILWKSSITEIRNKADLESSQSIESNVRKGLESPTQSANSQVTRTPAIKKSNKIILQNQGLPIPRNSRLLSTEFDRDLDRDLATLWQEAHDNTAFEIIARSTRLTDYKSSYCLVRSELTKPLNVEDQKDGHVYLYEVEGNKGFVKIGYTGRSTETRHREWEFDCNRKPNILYPTNSGSAMVVVNARRIEALCHAELDHRRIRIYCQSV